MKKILITGTFIFLLLITFTSCTKDEIKDHSNGSKKTVYTSFYPIEYMTYRIAEDTITIKSVVPQGQDVHDWEPTAKEAAKLYQADLLIINGAGLESWLPTLQGNVDSKKIIDTSKGISLLDPENHDKDHDQDHAHETADPHFWMSPKQAQKQAENIYEGLIQLNPDQKESYKKKYDLLIKDLKDLDKAYEMAAKKNKKPLFVMHNAFQYWKRDYGISIHALMGIHSEGGPDAKKMSAFIEAAKKDHIQNIYYNFGDSNKIAKTIADEIRAKVKPIYTMERITDQQKSQKDDYLSMMKKNAKNLEGISE